MPDPASDLDALADEFYAVWFRYRPDLALAAGVPGYGCLLPAQDDDELEALISWLESLLLGLDEVDCQSLDPDRRLDYALLAGSARLEHRELRALDWRRRDPLRFLPLGEIHLLTLEPAEGLEDWLVRVLTQVPEYLRNAQGQLREAAGSLSPILVRVAAQEADEGRCYLRELIRGPWLRGHCPGLSQLESLAELACDALAAFRDLLVDDLLPHAVGPLGCGGRHLALRLVELHFMDPDASKAAEALSRALSRVEETIRRLAQAQSGTAPDRLEASKVPMTSGAAQYQALCEGLRQEIQASGLVNLPQESLRVSIRPRCPGLEGLGVSYRAQDAGAGTLYLTSGGGVDAAGAEASLRDACLAAGWGGAHLMAFADRHRAGRMPRRLANARSLTLGWHLYLGRELAQRPEADPSRHLASLYRQREHLLLAQLDLDLHRGLADGDEALVRLAALGYEGPMADALLAQLARAPGDALAGALGWLLLEAARAEREASEGSGFSPRAFHDRLLSQGAVPLPLVLGSVFGEALWRRSCERVFSD